MENNKRANIFYFTNSIMTVHFRLLLLLSIPSAKKDARPRILFKFVKQHNAQRSQIHIPTLARCLCVCFRMWIHRKHIKIRHISFFHYVFLFFLGRIFSQWMNRRKDKRQYNKSYYYGDSGLAMVFVGRFYTKSQSHNVSWNTIYGIFYVCHFCWKMNLWRYIERSTQWWGSSHSWELFVFISWMNHCLVATLMIIIIIYTCSK